MAQSIRPIRMEDAAEISALLDWAWFAPRSEAGWRWLCRTPRSREARAIPVGYVAEDSEGRVGGVFGLFVQDYASSRGDLIGGTGHTLIVHPRLRGASRSLIDTALDNAGLFGVTVLNGNARAAPLYARHGFEPWPVERGDLTLAWITDPLAILAERAARAGLDRRGPSAPRPAERFMRDRLFQTDLNHLGPRTRVMVLEDIDGRFDEFWDDLSGEGRLTARRDAASWRWRLSDPDRTRDPLLLAWMDGDAIGGLLLAQISKINEITAPSLEIIDVVALEPFARTALPELVTGVLRNASRLGVSRVRMEVVTEETERLLAPVAGMMRRRSHIHGHVRFGKLGAEVASDWRLTPYDGEHGLCHRHPPRPASLVRAA